MTIQVNNSIKASKKWFAIVPGKGYQSYSVFRACEQNTCRLRILSLVRNPVTTLFRLFKGLDKCMVYSVWHDCELILLAPLYLYECHRVAVVGLEQNLDYQDFVYNDSIDPVVRNRAFAFLMAHLNALGIKDVTIGQLAIDSETWQYAKGYGLSICAQSNGVSIELCEDNHTSWFAQLGKHSRQNIRTAYNRLARDSYELTFSLYSVVGIGDSLLSTKGISAIRECQTVLVKRHALRYKYSGLLHWISQKYFNYTALSVPGDVGFIAIIRLNERLAAFMEGYVDLKRKALDIPRFAIDDDFSWYSPGQILLNETAKFLYERTSIRMIDLCRGTESYKFSMGGKLYNTSKVVFKTEGAS